MTGEDMRIQKFAFEKNVISLNEFVSEANELWPVVYVLSDGNIFEAYVGETTDLPTRISAHLKSSTKSKLSAVHIIKSDRFNKSATLDIESNLIKYISGDGQYKLQNANIGLANHNYYQKKWYWDLFKVIWNKLRAEGLARHAIEHIDNSDLFKYSPYKSLTREQKKSIIDLLRTLLDPGTRNIVLEGGAGTGKTVLAVFFFKLLHTKVEEFSFTEFGEEEEQMFELTKAVQKKYPDPKMALVIPMASFRSTIRKVFKNIKGLNAGMVVGPTAAAAGKFDIIVVDEAHRLRRRVTLGTYFKSFDNASEKLGLDKNKSTELDWVLQQAGKTILFYDKKQSIKPSDVQKADFDKLMLNPTTVVQPLVSQLRVKGGKDYVRYISNLLSCELKPLDKKFSSGKYELVLFGSIKPMISRIKEQNEKAGLSRLVAGYAWPWISKNDNTQKDILIEDEYLQWNSVSVDWLNSPNAINEVGCIHTTQGYDLNYAGVIFGNEISYDEDKNEIVIVKSNYHDRSGRTGIKDEEELKSYIINIYETLMMRAIHGTYIYVCDEKLRKYLSRHINPFKPTQSISAVSENADNDNLHRIPLYDLKAAAGSFGQQQKAEDYLMVPLPSYFKSSQHLFACRVIGESMNEIIPNGSICLFKTDDGGTRNGKIVLVELTSLQDADSGSSYTVKEYHSTKKDEGDSWVHETITLRPRTNSDGYKAIEVRGSDIEGLKVIGIFERVLEN